MAIIRNVEVMLGQALNHCNFVRHILTICNQAVESYYSIAK